MADEPRYSTVLLPQIWRAVLDRPPCGLIVVVWAIDRCGLLADRDAERLPLGLADPLSVAQRDALAEDIAVVTGHDSLL